MRASLTPTLTAPRVRLTVYPRSPRALLTICGELTSRYPITARLASRCFLLSRIRPGVAPSFATARTYADRVYDAQDALCMRSRYRKRHIAIIRRALSVIFTTRDTTRRLIGASAVYYSTRGRVLFAYEGRNAMGLARLSCQRPWILFRTTVAQAFRRDDRSRLFRTGWHESARLGRDEFPSCR